MLSLERVFVCRCIRGPGSKTRDKYKMVRRSRLVVYIMNGLKGKEANKMNPGVILIIMWNETFDDFAIVELSMREAMNLEILVFSSREEQCQK